ncbi:MAG: uracil-DNA glycosylase [Candidatus Nomurabacteria bacterium]|jgi:DNA polymerase|nr:uracil-DNA glycosylase [Candidatus Nomurabacteria bacterium]
MTTEEKARALADLGAKVAASNICPDLKKQAKNLVMGDGDADAAVVLIGEAPGKNEDERGLPFVGAAGKFLDEMLAAAGLDRKKVYITNIVKYRPPNNRDPLPEEKSAFWPVLVRQLEIIAPKIIVTLGRHSMEYFLPNARISQVHGQPRRVRQTLDGREYSWVVMPLYHPAAALYNGSLRQTLLDDFQRLPAIIRRAKTADDVLKLMKD